MKKKVLSMLLMGACFLASVSLFTSCKDYDDDIAANKTEIAALRAELTTVKSNLEASLNTERSAFETQIAALQAQMQSAIEKKADEATVKALQDQLDKLNQDYAARMAVLTTQVEAAYAAIGRLDEKADKLTVDGVVADLAALTGQLADETRAREAVEANLQLQLDALQKFMQEYKDANLQEQIDKLREAIGEIQTNQEITMMRTQMNNLEQMISGVNSNLSALTVLVERQLNSISLVPQLFINGIEAIEFTSLKYFEFLRTDDVQPTGSENLVSTGETTATYRLNPTTVQLSGLDVDNIDFLAARAEARETRAYGPMEKSPIAFNGIKDYSNGLMTVKIKKVTNEFLGDENDQKGSNDITIVALKVPRNASLYEAADVISENSRLVEKFYYPRIAARESENNAGFIALLNKDWTGTDTYYDNIDNPAGSGKTVQLERPCHFSDSSTIYNSRVDETPLKLVSKLVYYRDTFDVKRLVTGCKYDGNYLKPNCLNTITPEQLKAYGMEFRYALMDCDYHTNAAHTTNQQAFAKITPDGLISSKLPDGVTDNKACIGKEPIVRVELIDVVHHKVVDRRYLKIKWTDKKDPDGPGEDPQPKDQWLFDKENTAVLDWCGGITLDAITWEEFITKIYANIDHHSELNGISEQMFHQLYLDNPKIEYTVNFTTNWPDPSMSSAPNAGISDAHPVITKSPTWFADADFAVWDLGADKIKTVYCNSLSDTKTFTAKVLFKTDDKRYPNVYFNWKVTITLPQQMPSITGFYDQYWLNNKHEAHDILPLQYNTTLQKWWDGKGKKYCFYDNDLMNAFVWDNNRIVKGIPSCGSWDIQFSGNYGPFSPADLYDTGIDNNNVNHGRISKSGGKNVDTRYFYNSSYLTLSLIPWRNFDGYKKGALQLMWMSDDYKANRDYRNHDIDSNHKAWDNNPAYKNTYLRADKPTASLLGYLNPLDENPANDITGPDGTKQPKRTYNTPLDFNIWVAMNPWNYIPVFSYKAYMVAPLRVNWTDKDGVWQDGEVSGSPVPWRGLLSLTDFRGYLVSAETPAPDVIEEQKKYTTQLWDYYEVKRPIFDCENVKFSFKKVGGNVEIDNTIDPKTNGMTSGELRNLTQGNIYISFSDNNGTSDYIYFYNNGGSNIEAKVRVWIPVEVDYGWGVIKSGMYGWVYPHGEKPAAP